MWECNVFRIRVLRVFCGRDGARESNLFLREKTIKIKKFTWLLKECIRRNAYAWARSACIRMMYICRFETENKRTTNYQRLRVHPKNPTNVREKTIRETKP